MKTSTTFAAIEARSSYHGSCKRYFTGSRPDLNVPYREVSLSTTRHSDRVEENAPVPVYDTSGPYTDPDAQIDLTRGLSPLRAAWIEDRQGSKELVGPSSEYARLREDDLLALFERFPSVPRPRRALSGKNITQMHYARKGVITPEMEFVALRESMQLDRLIQDPAYRSLLAQHPGQPFGAHLPNQITPEFVRAEVAVGRAIIPANSVFSKPSIHPQGKISRPIRIIFCVSRATGVGGRVIASPSPPIPPVTSAILFLVAIDFFLVWVGARLKKGSQRSTASATPIPPPMQRLASPFFASRRIISCRSVTRIRQPEAPIG
jgi:hypothetical protein